MKYVSPICEIEAFETKDIIMASTNDDGVTVYYADGTNYEDVIDTNQTGAGLVVDKTTGEAIKDSWQMAVKADALGLNTNQ